MQQLGSAAHPDKSLMRTCKQKAALWEKELMASLDSSTESHLPSRDCMRQQLAASVLFVPYLNQTQSSIAIFPIFPTNSSLSTCCRAALFSPHLDHLNEETEFHHHSVLIAPLALGRDVYLPHKQPEATFDLVTLQFFSFLWQS